MEHKWASDQEVRWCPGCGDYAILASVQKILPELGIKRENHVFISGIGCSSRFPYYLNTYGFHTIHGRAPTIATGLKLARPELSVWIITGDGDGLSIGAGHLLHLMRRNIDVTILLFNNKIYGLTKGQYSPTSEKGKKTKTTPQGSLERPFDPIQLALAAGCTFVARAIDVDPNLQWILKAAASHQGTSFVEIYQNCNVFNDGAFTQISEKSVRAQRTVLLRPEQPLIFGQHQEKALSYNGQQFEVVGADEPNKIYFHRQPAELSLAIKLNELTYPEFPLPLGVFRAISCPTYEMDLQKNTSQEACLMSALRSDKTWIIE